MFKLDLYVYEMAARILFYMVHWLRSIKEFQVINVKDQVRSNLLPPHANLFVILDR